MTEINRYKCYFRCKHLFAESIDFCAVQLKSSLDTTKPI